MSCRCKAHTIVFLWIAVSCSNKLLTQQAAQPTAQDAFKTKDYPTFVRDISIELSGTPEQLKQKLDQVVAVAIAPEKTDGWDAPSGKQARELLSTSPDALRYLDAMRRLLQGDTSGLQRFFDGAPPNYSQWGTAVPVLREHGFELAANVFATANMAGTTGVAGWLDPKIIEQGVVAWLSIPKEDRESVDRFMATQLAKDWYRTRQIAQTALQLFEHPPAQTKIDAKEFYDLALRVGKAKAPDPSGNVGVVTLRNAQELSQAGKKPEAKAMVETLVVQNPTNERVQIDAAWLLGREMGEGDAALQVYLKALKTVPEPNVREVRLAYANFLKSAKRTGDLAALKKGNDKVLAADALFVDGKTSEAIPLYQSQIANQKSKLVFPPGLVFSTATSPQL